MPERKSRLFWPAVRALCSAAALYWVLRSIKLHSIASTLHQTQWPYLLLGMSLNLLARFAAAERTQAISRSLGLMVSRWQTIETLFISNFYALLSPGPVLSGVVSVYRYRGYGASMTGSITSLLASRAMECTAYVSLGTACLLLDPSIALGRVEYPLALAAAALGSMLLILATWWVLHRRWSRRARAVQADSTAHAPPLSNLRLLWREAMRRGPRLALQAALPAAAQVVLGGAALSILGHSLGIELSLLTAIWVSAAVYAVVLLPISVAGLGVREVTLIHSLALLSVSPRLAVSLSVLLFADPLVNALIGGLLQIRSTIAAERAPMKHWADTR